MDQRTSPSGSGYAGTLATLYMDVMPSDPKTRPVALWLFVVAGMILVMIVLGGATRLTGSGLSIMEWAPLMGALPPLSETEWQRLFALYQKIPQYDLMNRGFGLDGFKRIFWLEWSHRLWGRLIGLVFLVPPIWFWWTGRVSRWLRWRLVGLFLLGGLQGAVGWFMVASGFMPDTTRVSPYRLVIHLGLALVLYGAIVWTGLSLWSPEPAAGRRQAGLAFCVRLGTALVCLTILAGGFVAGLHAGLTYNTFPLMDGALVPAGYAELHPFVRNLTENIAAVQFDHRLLATLTVFVTLGTLAFGWPVSALRARVAGVGLAASAQYGLGVATLLRMVPLDLAIMHQAGAVLLLTAYLVLLRGIWGQP
jgi:cytochrome c oxidase assembly protein subunit 15